MFARRASITFSLCAPRSDICTENVDSIGDVFISLIVFTEIAWSRLWFWLRIKDFIQYFLWQFLHCFCAVLVSYLSDLSRHVFSSLFLHVLYLFSLMFVCDFRNISYKGFFFLHALINPFVIHSLCFLFLLHILWHFGQAFSIIVYNTSHKKVVGSIYKVGVPKWLIFDAFR